MSEDWKKAVYRRAVEDMWNEGIEVDDEAVINNYLIRYLGLSDDEADSIKNEFYARASEMEFDAPGIFERGHIKDSDMEKAIEEARNSPDMGAINRLANMCISLGRTDELEEIIEASREEIIPLEGGRAFYELWRGLLRYIAGRDDESLRRLGEITGKISNMSTTEALMPPLHLAYTLLILHHIHNDENDLAFNLLNNYSNIAPKSRNLQRLRAYYHIYNEEYDKARDIVKGD